MATALSFVPLFANDRDRPVVESVQKIAAAPRDLLVTDAMRPRYRRFVSDVFGARARALGWKPASPERTKTRSSCATSLVPFVANEGDEPALVADAMRLAKAWLKDRAAVDPAPRLRGPRRGRAPRRHGALPGVSRRGEEGAPTGASGCASSARSASSAIRPSCPAALNVTLVGRVRRARVDRHPAGGGREPRDARRGVGVSEGELRPARRAASPRVTGALSGRSRRDSATRSTARTSRRSSGTRRRSTWAAPVTSRSRSSRSSSAPRFKAAQQESVNDFLSHYEPRPTIDLRPRPGM